MSDATMPRSPSRLPTLAIWGLRIALALAFGAAALAKLGGVEMMVAEFEKIGLGQWFRYATALTELAGAVLILLPQTKFLGALVLTCVCVGAFIAQIGPLHGDVVHVLVLGALCVAALWLTRPGVRS